MPATAIKAMLLRAIGGSVLSGFTGVGCGHDSPGIANRGDASETDRDAAMDGRGGRGGGPAADSGMLSENCFSNPVGTCCRTEECFAPSEVVRDSAGTGGHSGRDEDAGTTGLVCPSTLSMGGGGCVWHEGLTSATAEECCYVRVAGDCCGRPFLVGGLALGAPILPRADWMSGSLTLTTEIDPVTRKELARAWLSDARLEHASIASFARFTLHALSLGAPANLIEDAQRAALDEVTHAKLCFALASRYADGPVGPGELPIQGAVTPVSLAEVAAASVREGCVAETVGAVQARIQLERARDPDARAALTRIADDEARHAELAWRFVRWALATGGEPVAQAVSAAFDQALARLQTDPLRGPNLVAVDTWHDHGRLTPSEERSGWLETARDVIQPCRECLMQA